MKTNTKESLSEDSLMSNRDINDNDGSHGDTEDDNSDIKKDYKKITELTDEDILGLEFDTEEEACQFYEKLGKCEGFAVRKHDSRRDNDLGIIVMRQLVCNKQGKRSEKHLQRADRLREHKPLTRTNCQAKFRVKLDCEAQKWKVQSFERSHNHEMTPSELVYIFPRYRSMSDADKAQVDSLHLYGVRTCHIMGIMLGQKGNYANLGFCKKDFYNHLDKEKRAKIEDGDAFAALCYLQAKADSDDSFYSKFTLTSDDRLQNLFWSDGASRVDYECFGEVVAFDTTYKKNRYNKPLVIFCGYNHHGETTIFGCALIADEKVETYVWVLEAFSESMYGKHPKLVVTDGDNAMREAINVVFPSSSHRLCSWHIHRNACENVKNKNFIKEFKDLIYSNFSTEVFELKWKNVIEKYELVENRWVKKIYEMKTKWATSYMREKCHCRIRTTSICEGINSFIKRYVQNKNSLVDFMHNFDRAVKEYRHNEVLSDFKSKYTEPVLTTALHKIEVQASKLFTRNKFGEVKNELVLVGALNVVDQLKCDDKVILKMNSVCNPDIMYAVKYDKVENTFECDCQMYDSCGIPCCHIFCAMKSEYIDVIPNSLICKRWTKSAKEEYMSSIPTKHTDSERLSVLRAGALSFACNRLFEVARKQPHHFSEISEEIYKLTDKIEKQGDINFKQNSSSSIRDPELIKTKGAPRKRSHGRKTRRCSHCRHTGHTIKTCKQFILQDQLCSIDENNPSHGFGGDKIVDDNVDISLDHDNEEDTNLMQSCKGEEQHDVSPDHDGSEHSSSMQSCKGKEEIRDSKTLED